MFETEKIEAKVQISGTLVFHDAQGNEVGVIEMTWHTTPIETRADVPQKEADALLGERGGSVQPEDAARAAA